MSISLCQVHLGQLFHLVNWCTSGLCVRSCAFLNLHFTHQLPHCCSQPLAPSVCWRYTIVISVSPTDSTLSVARLESCLSDLNCWLSHNGLCLNPSKSDAVLFGTQQRLCTFPPITSINIAGSVVNLSETVTTLGVNLDQTLNLQQHVNNLWKSSYYHLHALWHIRASLLHDICFSLATALIQSRLDHSNSILYGTSASNLHKLQMVQNALARTITHSLVQSLHLSFCAISTGSQSINEYIVKLPP